MEIAANWIQALGAIVGFCVVVVSIFVMRFKYRMGTELYVLSVLLGAFIFGAGYLVAAVVRWAA